jgi:hypothetical protein
VPVDALVIEVSIFDNSDASFRMRQGEIKKWHFFCESGNPEYSRHCETAQPARQSRIPSSLQQGFSCERSAAEA